MPLHLFFIFPGDRCVTLLYHWCFTYVFFGLQCLRLSVLGCLMVTVEGKNHPPQN